MAKLSATMRVALEQLAKGGQLAYTSNNIRADPRAAIWMRMAVMRISVATYRALEKRGYLAETKRARDIVRYTISEAGRAALAGSKA